MQNQPLLFVLPWYASPSEVDPSDLRFVSQFRETILALHMAGVAVEVLTTTLHPANAHAQPDDRFYEPGVTVQDGITVRRFPIGERRLGRFEQTRQKLQQGFGLSEAELEDYMREFMPLPEMLSWIRHHRDRALFFFVSFLYPTTFLGLRLAGTQTVLIPGYRSEPEAAHPLYATMAKRARALVFQSAEERSRLIEQWYLEPDRDQRLLLIPQGIDALAALAALSRPSGLARGPHQVVASWGAGGRAEESRLADLLEAWKKFKAETIHAVKLTLLVQGVSPQLTGHDPNLEIEILSEPTAELHRHAFQRADVAWVMTPSVTLHPDLIAGWSCGLSVIVDATRPLLYEHCRRAHGGLYYNDWSEFGAMLTWLIEHPRKARQIGQNGRKYLQAEFEWPAVVEKYRQLSHTLSPKLNHG